MKSKIFKMIVILSIILTMTMTNFIFVGSSLISYALDNNNNTNNNNVEFNAYFKNEKGEKVSSLDIPTNKTEEMLYIYLNVKQEGYLSATINLENGSNFELVESDNQYVESVKNNTIKLYNVTAGAPIEVPVKIKPIKGEIYNIGLLSMESKVNIDGIYKDSSQKDKKIKATKTVKLAFTEELSQDDIINEATIITNKVSNIGGEEKRVIQLSWNIGSKSNSYPIKEIVAKIKTPTISGVEPQLETQVNLNTMTYYHYEYKNDNNEITFTNEQTQEGNIRWKTEGTENIILTYIYDKNVEINDITIEPEVKVTLYDKKEINHTSQIILNKEEKDAVLEITTENKENEIYKGKLTAGIDRQYETKTAVKINLAKMIHEINIKENASTYTINETENIANIFYTQTMVKRDQINQILGENGVITISNQDNQVIGTINATTQANENGDIIINYGDSQTQEIKIQMTQPIAEGTLEINHIKNIKETQKEIVKQASRIHHVISYQYDQGLEKQTENNINLQNTVTESKIELDTDQLSTVVGNHINMKITLLSNEEKYDLYENPNFTITLPNQVQNIQVTNVSKLYDNNNQLGDTIQYAIQGNNIQLILNGKQTDYTSGVEGITIVVEADIQVNKVAATSDEQVVMTYQNANAVSYANDATTSAPIKIIAPKEITAVNNIKDLSVETIGEEEKTDIMMEKGSPAKQIQAEMEIINSNVATINDVKILGKFPTDNNENNMGIGIAEGVQVIGVDNAKVYYSANENATDDITNTQNGWMEELNGEEAKTYLILLDKVDAQSSIQANYEMVIPENLAYNKVATEGYSVNATNSETGTPIKVNATNIVMQTGIGPKLETQLQAMVGANTISENGTVKNGEVIKYQINVVNTGTEDSTNITVTGKIPEGTTLVEPMEFYPYTGAAYYQEKTEEKSYTTTIESLKVGESKVIEYEVRVNSDTQSKTKIVNEVEVQYGEAKTKSEITHITEPSNIRASIKQITEYQDGIHVGDTLSYFAIIENMSDVEQKDVTIQTNLSENAEVENLELISNMEVVDLSSGTLEEINPSDLSQKDEQSYNNEEDEEVWISDEEGEEDEIVSEDTQELSYQQNLNIGSLASGETKVLYYTIKAKSAGELDMSVIAKANNQTSSSNLWKYTIVNHEIKATMTTNTPSQFIQTGDEIDYQITLENNGTGDANTIEITDEIPNNLEIQSITIDGNEQNIPEDTNKIKLYTDVNAKSTSKVDIKTIVDYNENTEANTITNLATIEEQENVIAKTQEITHIIKANKPEEEVIEEEEDTVNTENGENNNNNNSTGSGINQEGQNVTQNTSKGNHMIAGVAWLDSDLDGTKDTGETLLSDIKVKLLNVETNQVVKNASGNEITATTNTSGIYVLQNIPNGKYIVIFEYDTTKYGLATYQASGVAESENSNAVMNELNVNGNTTKVASTDIITITDNDISNINIGLIKLSNFDLKLEKHISQVLIQNSTGSTIKKYDNADMAKVELDAKKVNGSTVLIEYDIKVSNVGEVDGYVKKIVDYMPSDLKFSSELNKDWYQTNGLLYNASLANEKIAAGETKTITLTLTKSMTENNTGLTTNVAEIAEDYNELGIKDSNSTPGNKAQGENDMSNAEVIISIRTGAVIYISIVTIILAIGIITTFVIIIRKLQKDDEDLII